MLLEILTSAERNFIDHYAQETLTLECGPAFLWLREHEFGPSDIRTYVEARQFELAAQDAAVYPDRPYHFEFPWKSKEEFHQRGGELDRILEPHREARCDRLQPPRSNG